MNNTPRCEGKRRKFRGSCWGIFKCGRKAKGTVTTNIGFSKTHYCCGDEECYRDISGGYPSPYKEFKA